VSYLTKEATFIMTGGVLLCEVKVRSIAAIQLEITVKNMRAIAAAGTNSLIDEKPNLQ
jgi:hypothetical protein